MESAGGKTKEATECQEATACLFWLGLLVWLTSYPEGSAADRRADPNPLEKSREVAALIHHDEEGRRRQRELGCSEDSEGRFLAWVTQNKWRGWERPEVYPAGKGPGVHQEGVGRKWIFASSLQSCNTTMVSGNLPILAFLLMLVTLWGSEGPQVAPAPEIGQADPKQVPIQSLQAILLRRLGLQRRPRPKPGLPVPQYLLDLYQFCLGKALSSLPDSERSFLEEQARTANTVRAFHHVDNLDLIPEVAGSSFYFLFNLTLLPEEEELMALELRLYHSQKDSGGFHVSIYHAMDSPSNPGNKSGLLIRKFLAFKRPKWESFDVTVAFKRAKEQDQCLGILVEVEHQNNNQEPWHQAPLRVRRSPGEEEAQWALERPLLVTYSHDRRGQPLTRGKRQSKSQPSGLTQRGGRRTLKIPGPRSKRKSLKPKTKAGMRCRRHRLFVDFKEVGWNDWIVAPSGYHAFYCSGECRFPLADHMNTSSHAVVQTMLNSMNSRVPKACCVPTDLSPIAMLYLDQHDVIVLKTYQDMVVEGCGCR